MTEHNRLSVVPDAGDAPPANPFPVSDNFKQSTPALTYALVETIAFVGLEVWDRPTDRLVVILAKEWSYRITGAGSEDVSHALAWEISALIKRMADQGVPFPPYDIGSRCADPDCEVDHAAQVRMVNDVFAAAQEEKHGASVGAYAAYVHADPPVEWKESRIECAAMLLVHVAQRVCEYRSGSTAELPPLS